MEITNMIRNVATKSAVDLITFYKSSASLANFFYALSVVF